MKLEVNQRDVWAATIEDRPGGLHEKLAAIARAGADLEFVVSRRSPEQRGKGAVFVTPIEGDEQVRAAQAAGFQKSEALHSVRIEGTDSPGVGMAITQSLAEAGINLRGLSGAALGRRFVLYLALDSAAEAAKAIEVLRQL